MSTPTTPTPTNPPPIDATAERLKALQAARRSTTAAAPSTGPRTRTSRATKPAGPRPSRIVAAAASVSAGIGLVALMAGAQQDLVIQVQPAPVTVQPANIMVEMSAAETGGTSALTDVEVRVVESATPAQQPSSQAKVVTQSEGS